MDEPNRIVASGYDRIAETYEAWMGLRTSPNTAPTYYRRFLDECLDLIPHGGLVLDLGCGAGRVAAEIGRRARVVGVDISIAQTRLARERVPTGAFLVADMAKLEFRSGSFDSIAAFYSVKGTETPIRLMTCIFRVTCDVTPCRVASAGVPLSTWPLGSPEQAEA